MTMYEVEVHISPWAEGGFLAEALGLQGCWVVSESVDQAVDEIREAVQLWIRVRREQNWPLPETLKESGADVTIRAVLPIGVP